MLSSNQSDLHIFDCDGVILDSNNLKVTALRSSLEFIEAPSTFIDWATHEFSKNFGRTRDKHFETFLRYAETQNLLLDKKDMNVSMQCYSENVVNLYKDCDVINETDQYIKKLPSSSLIYVVSASSQSELRSVLPSRCPRLKSSHIFGGPLSKVENIKNVMRITGINKAAFYGDSIHDAKAAITCRLKFYGLSKYSADKESLKDFCITKNLGLYSDCLSLIDK
jgi:phosphoglycolate phosphatase-like HAD superfamily hydrolase